nr:MAG TPA: Integrase [Caudoviricetes sp.]
MGSITFKAVVSGFRKADGTQTIRIRVTANRKVKYISTNIAVTESQLTRSGNIRDRAVLDKTDLLIAKMRAAASRIDTFAASQMSIDEIVQFIGKEQDEVFRLDFYRFADEIIAGKTAENTRYFYTNAMKALRTFTGKNSMDISEITSSFMRNFEFWLVAKYGAGARCTGAYPSCIGHIHAQARLRYNNEETGDVKVRNPFAYFHPARTRPAPHRNVSKDTIQTIIDKRGMLTKEIDKKAADMFVLSFGLMGMNAVDLHGCLPPKGDILIYNRTKTKGRRDDRAEMHVKIDKRIRPLFDSWIDPTGKRALRVYKTMTANTFSAELSIGLRGACKIMGITEPLTFYSARHTWATLAYSAGVDKAVINDCLCHIDKNMSITDIYIAKDWEVMWRANEKVLDLFDWSSTQKDKCR